MSKPGKPEFSKLLSGMPANKFDAREVLAKRRESRRLMLPFVPICAFGFQIDEALNNWPPARLEPGAEPTGVGIQTRY